MGSFGSREVTTQTTDLSIPLFRLFVNFVFLGFVLGLLIHEHDISIWSTYFDQHYNFIRYGKGLYFFWYVLSWYIVYVGVYVVLIEAILHPLLIGLIGLRHELHCELFIEVLFGLWVCGQIIGSWLDFEKASDCIKTHDCQSYFMQSVVNLMESICEYFTAYDYDEVRQAYILRNNNYCYSVFHAAPIFLMTILSTSLSYMMLLIVGPK